MVFILNYVRLNGKKKILLAVKISKKDLTENAKKIQSISTSKKIDKIYFDKITNLLSK